MNETIYHTLNLILNLNLYLFMLLFFYIKNYDGGEAIINRSSLIENKIYLNVNYSMLNVLQPYGSGVVDQSFRDQVTCVRQHIFYEYINRNPKCNKLR